MIANESWYPPELAFVLLLFFLCAIVILTSMISCFRAMLLSCKEFQWFRDRPTSLFYESASPDSKSPRLSHAFPKCCYGRVTASLSWKLRGRETLHTQGFPRRPCAGDMIQMLRAQRLLT